MNSQPPRATGGIRPLFTLPENIRMAHYGHEVYGQFETLMAVGGDIAPIDWKACLLSLRSCERPRLVAWICSGATRCRGMTHDTAFPSTGESLANLTPGPGGQQGQPQH